MRSYNSKVSLLIHGSSTHNKMFELVVVAGEGLLQVVSIVPGNIFLINHLKQGIESFEPGHL